MFPRPPHFSWSQFYALPRAQGSVTALDEHIPTPPRSEATLFKIEDFAGTYAGNTQTNSNKNEWKPRIANFARPIVHLDRGGIRQQHVQKKSTHSREK
jgi:hypothetical protein